MVRIPDRLSWEEATTIPVAYMIEHDALITNAHLQAGEMVDLSGAFYTFLCQSLCNQERTRVSSRSSPLVG